MKKLRLAEVRGFSSIFILVGMLLVAVALPIATKLVQQNQENRSNAASSSCYVSELGKTKCSTSGGSILKCTRKATSTTSTSYDYSWTYYRSCDCGCSSASCKSKDTFYYYNSTSKKCITASYCTKDKCTSAKGKTCYTSKSACTSANSSSSTPSSCKYEGVTIGLGKQKCVVKNGYVMAKCSSDGKVTTRVCASGCTNGDDQCRCQGNASPGSVKCDEGRLQTCKDGTWTPTKTCVCNSSKTDCGSNQVVVPVAEITLDKSAVTVEVGKFEQVTATVKPQGATDKTVTWSTSNSSVALANGGRITGVSAGSATVTARAGNFSKTVKVTVGKNACAAKNGVCRISCSNYETTYSDGKSYCGSGSFCCVPSSTKKEDGECNATYNGKVLSTYPTDSQACTNGGVYWTDMTATDGIYNWKCQGVNGGKDAECSAPASCTSKGGYCIGSVKTCTEAEGGKALGGTDCLKSSKVCCLGGAALDVGTTSGVTNTPGCKAKGGVCTTYKNALSAGSACSVVGYPLSGTVVTGLCPGDNKTVCCSAITTPTSNGGGGNGGGGNDGGGGGETTVDPTGITLDPTSLNVAVGGSETISATVLPDNANNTTVTWSSDKTAVATVDNGVVKGKSVGTAVITAKTSNGKTATANVTVVAAGTARISFKFSLRGIKPSYTGSNGTYDCFDDLKNLSVEVVNAPTNAYQSGLSASFEAVSGETNDKGDQVFKVTNLVLDSAKFGSVNTFNYVKVKGPFHLKRRMCLNNQKDKLPETTTCNIPLNSDTVYDFSDYTLLAGDVNTDGVINSVDYSYVKTKFDASADVSCGREGDLNMDGVVNSLDANLIKEALSSKDDE